MGHVERRRTARLPVGEALTAEIVGIGRKLTVVNVGPGGFAIATDEWLPSTRSPEVQFATPDRRWTSATFVARMSFTLMKPRQSGPHTGRYITGFAFRDAKLPKVKAEIKELVDQITSVLA